MKAKPRLRHTEREERESGASAIELVLWTPLLFLLMFATVQLGLFLFAQHVAMSAAQEGDRNARQNEVGDSQWEADSAKVAKQWADNMIGGLIIDSSWQAEAAPAENEEVSVTVSFSIVSVVPGWQLAVDATSEGPIECFYDTNGNCYAPTP